MIAVRSPKNEYIFSLVPVKLYFHRSGQFLDLSGRMGYKVHLGDTLRSQLTYQEISMLPLNGQCTDDSYDGCMYGILRSAMEQATEDRCTVPWIVADGNRKICTREEDVNTSYWIAWSRITNQESDCLPPCKSLIINVGARDNEVGGDDDDDYGEAVFYFPQRVLKSEEKLFYTFLSLMAEIGGYVGLFLGYSILNLAEVVVRILQKKIDEERLR